LDPFNETYTVGITSELRIRPTKHLHFIYTMLGSHDYKFMITRPCQTVFKNSLISRLSDQMPYKFYLCSAYIYHCFKIFMHSCFAAISCIHCPASSSNHQCNLQATVEICAANQVILLDVVQLMLSKYCRETL